MLRLTTLGGLALTSDQGAVAAGAAQRRKLAVLALLGASPTGVTREKMVATLWPDADETGGRAVLSQTLYATRRALQVDDLVLEAGGALRLNPLVVAADVAEWRQALEARELERAVALYGGPFLDGFHLTGAPEFERWVDVERSRIAQQYVAALDVLATKAAAESRHSDAVRWRRAAAASDPYSTPLAAALVDALTLAGDGAGALQAARVHALLLRADLDVEPHAMLAEAVERAERAAAANVSGSPRPVAAPPLHPTSTTDRSTAPARQDDAISRVPPPRRRRISRRTAAAFVVTALVAGSTGVWSWHSAHEAHAAGVRPAVKRLLVLPFAATDSATAVLGANVAEMLSATLDGVGPLVAVSTSPSRVDGRFGATILGDSAPVIDVANRVAATLIVSGHIEREGGRVRVTADVYDRSGPRITVNRATVDGEQSEMFELSDRLASMVVAQQLGAREGAFVRAASVTTSSGAALKDYFQAEAEYRALRYPAAMADLRRAIADDSTFALAYYRLATTADWLNLQVVQRDAIDAAVRYRGRLGPRGRALVVAYQSFVRRDVRAAERQYADILLSYPDDVEAHVMAAEIAFHFGPMFRRPFTAARTGYERVLALDPGNIEACVHLARIAAEERRLPALDSLVNRIAAANPSTPGLAEARALAASLHHDAVSLRGVIRGARGNSVALDAIGRALAQYAEDYPAADMALRWSRLSQPAVPGAPPASNILPAALALAQGRLHVMNEDLHTGWQADPDGFLLRAFAAMATTRGRLGVHAAALADTLWALPPTRIAAALRFPGSPFDSPDGLARIRAKLWVAAAMLDAGRGSADRAARAAALLESAPESGLAAAVDRRTASVLRAVTSLARADSAAALRALEAIAPDMLASSTAAETWLRAELLAAAGRDADADREYASISDGYIIDEALVPWARLRRAALARRDGDLARADRLLARGARSLALGDSAVTHAALNEATSAAEFDTRSPPR